MTNVRVGVLGAGDVAQHTYLPGIARLAREGHLVFAAVCDAIEERVTKAATTYGIPYVFMFYDAMLRSGEIDPAVNFILMQVHAETIFEAFAAGKHVYIEKPVATTLADADRVIAAARQAGLVLACAPALMTHPESQEIRQLIARGAIG